MRGGWKTRGHCHVYGNDLPHDNGIMDFKHIIERQTDPKILIPCLMAAVDPNFVKRIQPGDFLIAGQRFGIGKAHTAAYIAMESLGMRILCESTFEKVLRGAMNLGMPIMSQCAGITGVVSTGDEIEVDMSTGEVSNLSTGQSFIYPPVPPMMREIIENGGRNGFLQKWLANHPELAQSMEAPS